MRSLTVSPCAGSEDMMRGAALVAFLATFYKVPENTC